MSESGRIRPTERHRSKAALTLIEREEISRGIVAGKSIRAIAAMLGHFLAFVPDAEINQDWSLVP